MNEKRNYYGREVTSVKEKGRHLRGLVWEVSHQNRYSGGGEAERMELAHYRKDGGRLCYKIRCGESVDL